MKNVLCAVMVLTGTFIGAGFASGQEILQYFGVFGKFGILGVAVSCTLLGLFTYCTADNIISMGREKYICYVCKFRWVNWLLNCYMLLIFATMITAFGECVQQAFDFPKIHGVILIDAVTITILYVGAKGMVRLNSIVTPVIILGIVFLFLSNNVISVFAYNNFAISAFVYTSYNIISMPFVMVGMKDMFGTKKNRVWSAVMFGCIIFSLALCLLKILAGADGTLSIPLLSVVGENYTPIFILILALSMLTTAVSNGYGFAESVRIEKNIIIILLGVFSAVFSFLKFDFIVKYLYRFFGYMGLYILFANFYIFIKNREKQRKSKINSDNL